MPQGRVRKGAMMTPQPPSEEPKRKAWAESMRTVARYTNLGWTLVAAVVLGLGCLFAVMRIFSWAS